MVDLRLGSKSAWLTSLPTYLVASSPMVFVFLYTSLYALSTAINTISADMMVQSGVSSSTSWNHSEAKVSDETKTWSPVAINWSTTSFPEEDSSKLLLAFDNFNFNYTTRELVSVTVRGGYTWDKSIPPIDFQQRYCQLRCDKGVLVRMHDIDSQCPYVTCFPCSCSRPACEIYQICCPDISQPYFSPPQYQHFPAGSSGQSVTEDRSVYTDSYNSPTQTRAGNKDLDTSTAATSHHYLPATGTASNQVLRPTGTTSNQVSSPDVAALNQDSLDSSPETAHPTLYCGARSQVLTIRSCPKDASVSPEVVHRCESNLTTEETTLESIAQVTDNLTDVVYHNTFCAQCNRVIQPLPWTVQAKCKNYMKVYRARSQDELMGLVLQQDSNCHVEQTAPTSAWQMHCLDTWFSEAVVDRCNVSGQWSVYDSDVEEACAQLTDPSHKVMYQSPDPDRHQTFQLYRNLFCAVCNKEDLPLQGLRNCEFIHNDPIFDIPLPYSMLFNLNPPRTLPGSSFSTELCRDQWTSPSGDCWPVQCPAGKVLGGDNCSTALSEITGLGYRLRLWLLPLEENMTSATPGTRAPSPHSLLYTLYRKFHRNIEPIYSAFKMDFGTAINTSCLDNIQSQRDIILTKPFHGSANSFNRTVSTQASSKEESQSPLLYWLVGNIVAKDNIHRDAFEGQVVEILKELWTVDLPGRTPVTLQPTIMWSDSDVNSFCSDIEKSNSDIACFSCSSVTYVLPHNFVYEEENLFLNVTEVLACRSVSFPPSLYRVETTISDQWPVTRVTLDINQTRLTFTETSELRQLSVDENGILNVCLDLLNQKVTNKSGHVAKTDYMRLTQYVLTILCMSASMVCLALTIITYLKFSVLRSVAGRNNLGMCVSLLLAQASLLASAHVNVNSPVCKPIGVITHFLWLSMFCWSFICCFHMYRVFGAKTRCSRASSRSQRALLVKTLTFTTMTPAIFVGVSIIAAYFTSGGTNIGYGDTVCYLNSTLLVGCTMIGPLVLVSLLNSVFFLVTVVRIHQVRQLQTQDWTKREDQVNLYVYIKLSTLTGTFWLVFIIAELTDQDALRILAILLNGLQGVFVFMSYTCNKRVLELCLRSLGSQPTSSSVLTTEKTSLESKVQKNKEMTRPGSSNQSSCQTQLHEIYLVHTENDPLVAALCHALPTTEVVLTPISHSEV